MIFEGIAKMHFIVGLGMFVFIGLLVVSDDVTTRALLLLPIVIMFMLSKVLHAIDQANQVEDIMYRYKKRFAVVDSVPKDDTFQ
jgi:hypothetical protein